jgi:hypothetical protein
MTPPDSSPAPDLRPLREVERIRSKLTTLAEPVRTDYLRVVRAVVGEAPRRWRAIRGAPWLWIIITRAGDIRVEPLAPGDLGGVYLDEKSPWQGTVVRKKLADHRCVALVFPSRYLAVIGWGDHRIDVAIEHAAGPRRTEPLDLQLTTRPRRVPLLRRRFHPALYALLDESA